MTNYCIGFENVLKFSKCLCKQSVYADLEMLRNSKCSGLEITATLPMKHTVSSSSNALETFHTISRGGGKAC